MQRPTILTLLDHYLPGYKHGGPITTVRHMAQCMSDHFRFRVITRDRDDRDTAPYSGIIPNTWSHIEGVEVCHLQPGSQGNRLLCDVLKNGDYDVLYLNSMFSPKFTIRPLVLRWRKKLPPRQVVLAPRGELSPGALRIKPTKKKVFIQMARLAKLYRGIRWQASSEFEKRDIKNLIGTHTDITIAPDVSASPMQSSERWKWRNKPKGVLRILFLSRVCQVKNLDGALSMLGSIKGKVIFNIVGPIQDTHYWLQCQSLQQNLPQNIDVHYFGSLPPAEVRRMMVEHDLFFLPTHSENFGHVIIEALSSGCPVLISDQTPWRDLASSNVGWDLPLIQERQFQQVLQQCVDMDPQQFRTLREAAWRYSVNYSREDEALRMNYKVFTEATRPMFAAA